MDPKEIFDYMEKGISLLGAGIMGYSTSMSILYVSSLWPFRKKIKSQEELDEIVQTEAEKLSLDSAKIISKLSERGPSRVGKEENGERHVLSIKKGWQSTKQVVRHELYHIFKSDCEKECGFLRYYFIEELRANLYGTFGIKL